MIGQVEAYINTLANTPKEFDKSFAAYKAEFKTFTETIRKLEIEAADIDFKAGSSAAAGVAAGVGTAALGPSALMAVATTFGTASTGAAISTLGGAAATNAALAWLGGGAVMAGGSGMAGGSALVAMTGPIGWAIGGAALVGSGLFARSKNRKVAEEANAHRKVIDTHNAQIKAAAHEVNKLLDLTKQHVSGVETLLRTLTSSAPADYCLFETAHKEQLGALINHIRSLSELLNMKVDPSGSGTHSGARQGAKASEKSAAAPIPVRAPKLAQGIHEVQITLWNANVGDLVEKGEVIALAHINYESFEVTSPVDGILASITDDDPIVSGSIIAEVQPVS